MAIAVTIMISVHDESWPDPEWKTMATMRRVDMNTTIDTLLHMAGAYADEWRTNGFQVHDEVALTIETTVG